MAAVAGVSSAIANLPLDLGNNNSPSQIGGTSAQTNFQSPQPGGSILPTGAAAVRSNPLPTNNAPVNSGGGGGGNNGGMNLEQQMKAGIIPWDDNKLAAWRASQGQNAQDELAARNAQIQTDIHSAYSPIYTELDRQIGLLPSSQATAEQGVGNIATGQVNDINTQKASDISDINSNIDTEKNSANMNLNDLSTNIRNMLKGAAFYLGALGSGDSSAAQDYTTAITNSADMTRGKILNTRDVAINQLNQKQADVNAAATKNLNDVDTWKSTQLTTIAQEFRDQLNQLNMTAAQTHGQEGMDIANLKQSALDNFYSRLKQLDDTVFNYKAAISQWQTERQGWLQDQLTLMNQGAQYNSTTSPAYQSALSSFNNTFNPKSASGAPSAAQLPGSGAQSTTQLNPLQKMFQGISSLFSGSGGTPVNDTSAQVVNSPSILQQQPSY